MKLDHVGIVVKNIEEALPFYREALGLVVLHREEVPSQQVRVALLGETGESSPQVELLELMGEQSPVLKFLKTRGPGMHHVAFQSREIGADMKRLSQAGWPPMEAAARRGSRGRYVCFIHPRRTNGVLVELVG